ncbi:hypothetical protein [Streptomyces violaceoruber]|uniref:hypothetical protein n=1 Tax=Streptomyces violaceoruber TaxID=1935 RepID=UPI003B4399F6
MSGQQPVVLEGIPVFTGDLALLDTKVTELAGDGAGIATATGDIHSSFGGLQAFYKAPEADQLFATTKPVADRGAALKSDLATITAALRTYSDDAHPLVEKLRQLKRDAGAFLVKINAEDKWREDGDLVEENNRRHAEIAETWAAFQAVELACYNKIISLVPGGKPLTTDDGSGGEHTHGYDSEVLKQAKGLPWGDPVEESKPWYHLHEHGWDFVKGFAVDGVLGTVKGLGTLVGVDGWEGMKQAWGGLAQLSIGAVITTATYGAGGVYLLATPEEHLPSWLRGTSRAMKETGKALIAYDQWGENPARAGGAVTFNVLTTVFTGGTGAGVSGAGKAALAAKAISFANKASRVVDPTTYLFKGAGAGLTKISNVMTGLKDTGRIEIPPLPPGVVTLPDGAYKVADGTLHLPEGAAVPEGAFEIPKGSVKLPDGAELPAGAVDLGDGIVHLPEGTTPPAGSLPIQAGSLKLPEGTTALPEGTARGFSEEGNAVLLDREGNILSEDGTLLQHHSNAKRENPPAGNPAPAEADTPLPRTPAHESALVGTGARGGNDTVRLGSDLGGTGHIRTESAAPDNTPNNSVGDHSRPGNEQVRTDANAENTRPPKGENGNQADTSTGYSHEDHHSSAGENYSGPSEGIRVSPAGPGTVQESVEPISPREPQPLTRGGETEQRLRAAIKGIPGASRPKPAVFERVLERLAIETNGHQVAEIIASGKFNQSDEFGQVVSSLGAKKENMYHPGADQIIFADHLVRNGIPPHTIDFEQKIPVGADIDVRIKPTEGASFGYQMKRLNNPIDPVSEITRGKYLLQLARADVDHHVMLVDGARGTRADWISNGSYDELMEIHNGKRGPKGEGITFVIRLEDGKLVIPPGSKTDPMDSL